jgi:hypothetical protein
MVCAYLVIAISIEEVGGDHYVDVRNYENERERRREV